ncbi:MAG: flagellin-like protein [Clostridia bacterium]|nr:flagellin-like protein [Clostridia bacterium]
MLQKLNTMATYAVISMRCKVREFMKKENGDVNIVSIVVLIGIAVLLAILFRKQVGNLINNLFNTIGNNANSAVK